MGSIRLKMMAAILLIVIASFVVMATSLTGMVSNYLYRQQIRADSLSVEKLATTLAPLVQSSSADRLYEEVTSAAGELGGRLLFVDTDGKVQCDSFSGLNGSRLELPEILSVLTGGESSSYGIHQLDRDARESESENSTYASCCAARVVGTSGTLGVLVLVSPIDEMMNGLHDVEHRMTLLFVTALAAAVLIALLFTRLLTKPIVRMTDTIQQMGRGDLSARVPVRGSGELRELAVSYNTMAEQLESLDQSRNQFVSNASHELKTPLTTMKILLESLIYQPDMPADMRTEFMKDMNHEIDRLTRIITDLLALTKTDDHQMVLNLRDTDLSELTKETIHMLQPMAEKRGQTLELRVEDGVSTLADPERMRQVFYNLTDNAVKYTPEGGRIIVRLSRKGKNIIWQVEDNGPGIPEKDLSRVFERFYRVDKARSRDTGGTGLGLSIVKQLTSLHGGTVEAACAHPHGAVFTVTLPYRRQEDNA